MLYEQAAYEFLFMGQYRKFALWMHKAATHYGNVDKIDFQLNCVALLHPFYRTFPGWNTIQYKVLTKLSTVCQALPQMSAYCFKDLLELAFSFPDAQRQLNCLSFCKKIAQNPNLQGRLVEFYLPKIAVHTLDVYVSSELISSCDGIDTIGVFSS